MDKSTPDDFIPTALKEFIGIAVHELKTPIAIIKAYLQLMARQLDGPQFEQQAVILSKIDLQVDRLIHLIADMRDGIFTDPEHIHCHLSNGYPLETIKHCVEAAKAAYPNFEIVSSTDGTDPLVAFDRERIEQVVHNLMANAVKYASTSKYIAVSTTTESAALRVAIADRGPGIPPSERMKIFEKFHRINSKESQGTLGFGLGLYICSQIIANHGGEIGVGTSEYGGAEFWFTLPCVQVISTVHS